jgi:hypothetical protein
MVSDSAMTESPYYKLADFLGIQLEIANGKIKGKGHLKTDWGLKQVLLIAEVFAGRVYKDDSCALLLAAPKDLGIAVCFEPGTMNIDLFVIDRSRLVDRGRGFLDGNSSRDGAKSLFAKKCAAQFEGRVGGRFRKV